MSMDEATTTILNALVGAPKKLNTHRRAHRASDPLSSVNKRTLTGKRIKELVERYLELLGNPQSVEVTSSVIAAAELQVIAEQARFNAIERPPSADEIDQIVRLEAAVGRAIRKLGINEAAPRKPADHVTLADIEREHIAGEAAE